LHRHRPYELLLDETNTRSHIPPGCEPFLFELRGGSHTLTVGFGGRLGHAQYAASDGEPPYMVTLAEAHPGLRIEEDAMGCPPS
jgi:hypothetical protein